MTINYSNCFAQTGYRYEDLLAYTGVFGIHPRPEFISLHQQGLLTHEVSFNEFLKVVVKITSPVIEALNIIITGDTEIYIDLFRLNKSERGNGLGFKRLVSQIEELEYSKFTRIRLWAYGSFPEFPEWDGYIVWGKYGFTMYRNNELNDFAKKMSDEMITTSKSVNDLVASQEGTALWKHIGNGWKGVFSMERRSRNMSIYRSYRKKKNV